MIGDRVDEIIGELRATGKPNLVKAADMMADRKVPTEMLAFLVSGAGFPVSASTIKAYRRRIEMEAKLA